MPVASDSGLWTALPQGQVAFLSSSYHKGKEQKQCAFHLV